MATEIRPQGNKGTVLVEEVKIYSWRKPESHSSVIYDTRQPEVRVVTARCVLARRERTAWGHFRAELVELKGGVEWPGNQQLALIARLLDRELAERGLSVSKVRLDVMTWE